MKGQELKGRVYKLIIAALITSPIIAIFLMESISFNLKLISMVFLIFLTYYMVIEFKKIGVVFVTFLYMTGMITIAAITRFADYYTNAIMAFQLSTLISVYYLYTYVVKNELANQRLYESSILDDMTGIYNKRYYRIKAEEEIARASRYQVKFAMILIDVNHFKLINDTYGHLYGDEILKSIAIEVGKGIRTEDTFCRYGGDEFIILISNYCDLSRIRVRKRIQNSIDVINAGINEKNREAISISISMGFAVYPEDGLHLDDLFACADREMYKAKIEADKRFFGTESLEACVTIP
jgi:diguanylate cyclase (GGDEF)-like protein